MTACPPDEENSPQTSAGNFTGKGAWQAFLAVFAAGQCNPAVREAVMRATSGGDIATVLATSKVRMHSPGWSGRSARSMAAPQPP